MPAKQKDQKEMPGWAPPREPQDEPPARTLTGSNDLARLNAPAITAALRSYPELNRANAMPLNFVGEEKKQQPAPLSRLQALALRLVLSPSVRLAHTQRPVAFASLSGIARQQRHRVRFSRSTGLSNVTPGQKVSALSNDGVAGTLVVVEFAASL